MSTAAVAGDYFSPDNYPNMAALLSMYAIMPAFAAVAYIPSITLGKPHAVAACCITQPLLPEYTATVSDSALGT